MFCEKASNLAASQVTVVIPAYNPGSFLDEALRSVAAQTAPPGRVIVIDDGSDPPVRPEAGPWPFQLDFLRLDHAGQAAARNAGLAAWTTDLIAFLDADDVWHPLKLEWQLVALIRHPTAACVGCRAILIDGTGHCTGLGPGGNSARILPLDRTSFIQGAADGILVPSMVLMRRGPWLPPGGFDGAFHTEDLVYFDEFFAREGEAMVVDLPLLKRRMHGGNLTFAYRNMLRGYMKWLKERVEPDCGPVVAGRLHARLLLICGLSALAVGNGPEARQLLRRALAAGAGGKALAGFLFACLGPEIASVVRRGRHAMAGRMAARRWSSIPRPS
ncbi:MAG: Glycosyl transferase, family 2 [Candidatus Ozemobacter sibiricus]|uniref:Glycosyl transferase, family 2 n=1 Tax=Candidatus Ozemobacter sibiricus TaxID=2268124 RepID=A0A367ZKE6_9BACT|nr:MAG: Glycosyl transferase, family 2 [Candidatus Ozemobacter sibiricus]